MFACASAQEKVSQKLFFLPFQIIGLCYDKAMSKRIRHHVNPLGILTEHSFGGFGDAKDVIVDIGAFKGEFLAGLLAQFPEQNYVAMEVRSRVAEKLEKRFADDDNVVVFDGDGTRNFRAILEPCQNEGALIKEVYVNFPDPWPKEKHKKRRIANAKFLAETAQWLDPRTTWIFQTDREDVFADTIEMLDELGYAHEQFDTPPYGMTTDWEDAKVALGQPIYRMKFWIGAPAIEDAPESIDLFARLSEATIGAVAFVMLRILHWLKTDDGH